MVGEETTRSGRCGISPEVELPGLDAGLDVEHEKQAEKEGNCKGSGSINGKNVVATHWDRFWANQTPVFLWGVVSELGKTFKSPSVISTYMVIDSSGFLVSQLKRA